MFILGPTLRNFSQVNSIHLFTGMWYTGPPERRGSVSTMISDRAGLVNLSQSCLIFY